MSILKKIGLNIFKRNIPPVSNVHEMKVKDEYKHLQFASVAIEKLIENYNFVSVLDIGAGSMDHSIVFAKKGKSVTAVDFGVSVYHKKFIVSEEASINRIYGDFNNIDFQTTFDCVWASHILEHQPSVDIFLRRIISLTNEGGVIAITVPPAKNEIVGGHLSLWNAGLLLYRLVLCGIDCSQVSVLKYGYNISVIVKKKSITLKGIEYDCGDIRRIRPYLPNQIKFSPNVYDDPFDGEINKINW